MKGVVIASNASGGGKTTLTLGLMKALIDRGYDVQGFKVGPDYIDPAFHEKITGKSSRNLDFHLMGEKGVKASFSRGKGDVAVVEGVMGFYDGKGITSEGSTAHIASMLNLPIILVITPKSQSLTLCAELKGILEFGQANIQGIIFNNITESYFKLLKALVEQNLKLKVYGYLPKHEGLALKSRHLGLVQSSEVKDLEDKIKLCSSLINENLDMEELIKDLKTCESESHEDYFKLNSKNINIAIAKDEAFSFYYKENIELLEQAGTVKYFSPLRDEKLPENIDFLYIGGGYPEVFREELSKNKALLQNIRVRLEKGLRCYAECGGLMYLTEAIEGSPQVGFFRGQSFMTSRLQNFGYANLEVVEENVLLPKGASISCHEFHKSYVDLEEKAIYEVKKNNFDNSQKVWSCGYIKNNTLGAYAHVHFFGNMKFLDSLTTIDMSTK